MLNRDTVVAAAVGLLDAAAFVLLGWIVYISGSGSAADSAGSMTVRFLAFLPAAWVPLVVVAWRGAADARRILRGRPSWLRLPVEAFALGLGGTVCAAALSAITEVHASGGWFDGARSFTAAEWLWRSGLVLLVGGLFGGMMAAAGLLLTGLNRLCLRLAE
jgi:hypothetical protein